MSNYMFKSIYTAILAAGLLFGASLKAGEPVREKLRGTIEAALDVLYTDCCTEMSLDEKQAEVRKRIEANFELDVIIRRAIGRNWRLMDASEQKKVLELVKQLVVKAYVKGMDGKAKPQVSLGEVTTISEKRIEIQSTVSLDGKTYYVLYRLGRLESGWQIYDIVAENISVVSNYRQQIDDHFRQGSAAGLIARLEELLTKENIDEDLQL